MDEEKIRFIDLFAGVGGFHLGLTQVGDSSRKGQGVGGDEGGCEPRLKGRGNEPYASTSGFTCIWANEWDKYATQTYRKNFPETPLSTGDIRGVPADAIPDHDLLCAGFPCQAFSIAGKRRGFEETRGTLFFEIARIAECKRPKLLLLENVKGLLSHDDGKTFAVILRVLGELGYWCEWQVLNSKWFGVPQNRERVFIIGHLGEEPTRTVFPITEISGEPTEATGKYRTSSGRNEQIIHTAFQGGMRVYDDVSPTISTPSGGGHLPYVASSRIRRLTPVECERLQGFPDGWTEGVSDTQRYKQMGNAVTVNVVRFVGERIKKLNRIDCEAAA